MKSILALVLAFSSGAFRDETLPGRPAGTEVGIDQRPGARISMNLPFRDEVGHPLTLREASGGRPFILALVYYRCPMLCNVIVSALVQSLVEIAPSAGQEFSVLTVSFDPAEGPELARAKKAHYLRAYGRSSADSGWRFLTGPAPSVTELCRETGFRVSYDPATGLYGHASAILVLTADGRISRYFMGVVYPPRDLRLALVEASQGRIGTAADKLLLLCLSYDPRTGKYTVAIWRLLRGASAVTVLGLVVLIVRISRRRGGPAPRGEKGGRPEPGRA